MIDHVLHGEKTGKFLGTIKGRRIKSYYQSSLVGSHNALQQLQMVSKRAAMASKQKFWDNPNASVDAAQSAVDTFESTYESARSLVLKGYFSLKNVYQATKTASQKLEHHLLVPVRDLVLLPTFSGIERAVDSTISFVKSEQAHALADQSLRVISSTPIIGENVLAPAVIHSVNIIKCTWNVIQYPIPDREFVRQSVESSFLTLKVAVANSSREIYFYVQLVDASITRALSHTQWRILGSGPYIDLSLENQAEILNHISERYLNMDSDVSRYEFVCHIRHQNKILYHDLISSGLLYERGGEKIRNDVWLCRNTSFAHNADILMMNGEGSVVQQLHDVCPIWWFQACAFGESPKPDAQWYCFDITDQFRLEEAFEKEHIVRYLFSSNQQDSSTQQTNPSHETCTQCEVASNDIRWYTPSQNDVFVDQKRHAVSFVQCCSRSDYQEKMWIDRLHIPLHMHMTPTFWRFQNHEPVRRGSWMMDTKRYGLQPYSEESSAILEHAYHFLRWKKSQDESSIDKILLTVQVSSPDGQETQLVQFRSLTHITAIPKTVAGGVALFKRRVYRGSIRIESADSSGSTSVLSCEKKVDDRLLLASNGSILMDAYRRSPLWIESHNRPKDEATHLVLVVHGIGEMLKTTDAFGLPLPGLSSTIIDCCNSLRKNHEEVLNHFYTGCEHSMLEYNNGRVEYLPVEWHEKVSMALRGTRKDNLNDMVSGARLSDITLPTIPHLRNFANDTMLDILYFMSPRHHDIMVNVVVNEMIEVVERYRKTTLFSGNISILSHSLGSVISWDILSHMGESSDCSLDKIRQESPHQSISYPRLPFTLEHMFMIGSPLAVFLSMRHDDAPLPQDFFLPTCPRVYNIFHPYDPVAYRMEPILCRENASVEPTIIPHWKGGFRVQYQTKFLWRKILDETKKNQKWMIKAVESGVEGIGLLDHVDRYDDSVSISSDDSDYQEVHVGQLNQGKRIDYLLQEKEIETANEYLAALAAHSNYWQEKDLANFIAMRILNVNDDDDHDNVGEKRDEKNEYMSGSCRASN